MTLDILERYAEWCYAERRYIFNFLLSVVTLPCKDANWDAEQADAAGALFAAAFACAAMAACPGALTA